MAMNEQAHVAAPAALAWETPELINLGSAEDVEAALNPGADSLRLGSPS